MLLAAAPAQAGGGPHLVDDAGIVPPDSCELEVYGNWTGGQDWRGVISPTCASSKLGAFEIGIIAGFEEPGIKPIPGLSTKTVLGQRGIVQAAAEISIGFDPEGNTLSTISTNVPASFQVTKWLQLNLNAGVDFETGAKPIPTFGIGGLAQFADGWQAVAEVAGRHERPARRQLGVRYTRGAFTFDVMHSTAIDEASNGGWVTLGVVWAFGLR